MASNTFQAQKENIKGLLRQLGDVLNEFSFVLQRNGVKVITVPFSADMTHDPARLLFEASVCGTPGQPTVLDEMGVVSALERRSSLRAEIAKKEAEAARMRAELATLDEVLAVAPKAPAAKAPAAAVKAVPVVKAPAAAVKAVPVVKVPAAAVKAVPVVRAPAVKAPAAAPPPGAPPAKKAHKKLYVDDLTLGPSFSYNGTLHALGTIRDELRTGKRMADIAVARNIGISNTGRIHQAGRQAFTDWDAVCMTGKELRGGAGGDDAGAGDSGVAAAAVSDSDSDSDASE